MSSKAEIFYILSYVVAQDCYAVLGTYDIESDTDLTKVPRKFYLELFDRHIASETSDDIFLLPIDVIRRDEGSFVGFKKELSRDDWENFKDSKVPEVDVDPETESAVLWYPLLLNRSVEDRIEYWVRGKQIMRRNRGGDTDWVPSGPIQRMFGPGGIMDGILTLLEKKYPDKSIKIITSDSPSWDVFEKDDEDDDEQYDEDDE